MKKWKEQSREVLVKKYGRGIEKVEYEMPSGDLQEYYLNISGHPVCIFALTKNNEVILARQFRPGPNKILLELPGGGIDNGEALYIAAERELLEETGYKGKIEFVTRVFSDGYSPLYRHCFVATDCIKIADQKLDDTEDIDVELLSLKDFRKHLRSGQLTDTETGYLGLDHLGLL